jgi:PKD repeat protein
LAVAPSGRVYATFGGYNSGNVWQSSNNGLSWVNISANLPFAPMNSIVVAPADTNTLYVGSDVGIYGTSNNGGTWATGSDGPANVAVDQLFWMGNKLIAVSHGRGIWSTVPNLGPPALLPAAIAITGGNGNGALDPNECNFLNLTVTNGGGTSASAINATLSSPTPGVSFLQNSSSYGTIPSGGTAVNSTAFRIGTTPDFVCGTPVIVNANLTYAGGSTSISYTLPSGGSYTMNMATGASLIPGDTDIGNHGDNDVTSLVLPFPVLFYGRTFTNVNVVANGNLQFLSANIAAANICLPAAGFNYAICPFWSDLRTDLPGNGVFTTLTGSAPNRIFGIEWRATVSSTLSNVDFEVLCYESQPRVDIVYGAMDDSGTAATVGLQSGTGISFTNFECNAGGLTAGLQLTYQAACTDGGGTCPPPVITGFTADTLSGSVPLLVNFTNLTTGATNYNWQFGDGNSSTDINPTNLYLNAGKYSVTLIASGPGGTNALTRTNYVNVTNIPPNITVQPLDTIVALGSNTSLSVTATGTSLGYQWRLGGSPLANATNSVLLRNNVTCARAGSYDVIVSNTAGSVLSSPTLLTVIAPPGIASQPIDQTVAPGQTAQFTIIATNECGSGSTYQWQFFGTNLLGSTGASLSIPNAQLANAGPYDVVVTNFAGSITSTVATLNLSIGPVVILWPNLSGSNLVFYFATDLGRTYTVQYEDSFGDTNWQTAQTIPGDGTTNTFVAPVSDAAQRFFRLSVQ